MVNCKNTLNPETLQKTGTIQLDYWNKFQINSNFRSSEISNFINLQTLWSVKYTPVYQLLTDRWPDGNWYQSTLTMKVHYWSKFKYDVNMICQSRDYKGRHK